MLSPTPQNTHRIFESKPHEALRKSLRRDGTYFVLQGAPMGIGALVNLRKH